MPNDKLANVAGVILCGGNSRRMGHPKWAMKLAGRPMLDFATAALADCVPLVISVGYDQTIVPSLASAIVVRDSAPNAGPLQGIRAAAKTLATDSQTVDTIVVLSCDVPLVNATTIRSLVSLLSNGRDDAVVARSDGRIHPTIAAYRLEPMRDLLLSGSATSRRLDALVEHLRCRLVDVASDVALNVNTPSEAERAAALLTPRGLTT